MSVPYPVVQSVENHVYMSLAVGFLVVAAMIICFCLWTSVMNIESYLVKYSGPNRDKLTPAELVFDGKLPMGARQAVAQAAGAAAGAAASAVKSGFRGHREGIFILNLDKGLLLRLQKSACKVATPQLQANAQLQTHRDRTGERSHAFFMPGSRLCAHSAPWRCDFVDMKQTVKVLVNALLEGLLI